MSRDKSKLMEAIEYALEEYEKEEIVDFVENYADFWSGKTEPLNHVHSTELKKILFGDSDIVL